MKSESNTHVLELSYNYNRRSKRQAGPADNIDQTDVNVTVPFMFSARLYPYGETKHDQLLSDNQTLVVVKLKNASSKILGRTIDTIYIAKDGVIGFDKQPDANWRLYPTSDLFLAPYWSQNPEGQ
uniref:Uncharacterized protein n=1 Tax=Romanomermis culicivorax TaxID=13658 RepID=A0A915HS39_ROMCU